MDIYASLSMCRKLVSYTCWKLASYKSAGKFPTKCFLGITNLNYCVVRFPEQSWITYFNYILSEQYCTIATQPMTLRKLMWDNFLGTI